jgi:hypothetical protein
MVVPIHIFMCLPMTINLSSMESNQAKILFIHKITKCSRLKNMIITIMVIITLLSKVFIIEAMTMMLTTLTVVKNWARYN